MTPVTVFEPAGYPASLCSRMAGPEFDKSSKRFSGQRSRRLSGQQDLNSPSYYGERRCDDLRHKWQKLNFAIEPDKTPKRATTNAARKIVGATRTAIELFVVGVRDW